jgi:hypothetical protein
MNLGLASVDWRTLAFWLVIATFGVGGGDLQWAPRARPAAETRSGLVAWQRYCGKLAARA